MNIEQDIDYELKKLRVIAWRMDALFYIPGMNISVGLDNFFGLIPVVGDTMAVAPSLYMIYKAKQLGATPGALAYMISNTVVDLLIGSIPIIGDVFDVAYNSNIRNYRALERNLNRQAAQAYEVTRQPKYLQMA